MVIRPLNRPPRSFSEGTAADHTTNQERPPSMLDGLLGGQGTRMLNIGGGGGGGDAASAAATRLLMMNALGNSLRPASTPTLFPVGITHIRLIYQ